jgi:uncharacterized protein
MSTRPLPTESGPLAPFWAGARRDQLMLPFCSGCDRPRWPLHDICGHCGESECVWREISGQGRVTTFAVVNRAFHPSFADEVPYVLCVIELDAGVRMLGRVANRETADADLIGAAVEARFVDVESARLVYWDLIPDRH